MFNIDNFYYLLEKIIARVYKKPLKVFYYLPYGSVLAKDLCCFNHEGYIGRNPVVYLYDQEPLSYVSFKSAQARLKIKEKTDRFFIFGNSEFSKEKKKILNDQENLIDFYYFFHGFAARDWYRNNEYYCLPKNYNKDFLLNCRGISGARSYRILLVSKITALQLNKHCYYSFGIQENEIGYLEIAKNCKYLRDSHVNFIEQNLSVKENITYDDHFSKTSSALINDEVYSKIRFAVIAETNFYEEKLFLTEKIFQPIVTKTPFILLAGKDNLEYLRRYGFKTYEKWLDNADDNPDWEVRLNTTINSIHSFCNKTENEKDKICEEMQEIAEYNYKHFYGEFFNILLNELENNFQQSLEEFTYLDSFITE